MQQVLNGAHLLNAVKLMEPGSVLAAGQTTLALQAVVAVLQPCLQLLALCTKAQLHQNSTPNQPHLQCTTFWSTVAQ